MPVVMNADRLRKGGNRLDAAWNKLRDAVNDYHAELENAWRGNRMLHGLPQNSLRSIYNDVIEAMLLLDTARLRANCDPGTPIMSKPEAAQALADACAHAMGSLEKSRDPAARKLASALSKAELAGIDSGAAQAAGQWF